MDGLAPKMDGAQAGDRCPTTDASASSVSRRALSSFWREPKRTCMFEGMHRTVLVSLVFLGFSLQAVSVNFQKGDCRGVTKPGRVFSAEMCMKPLSTRPFSPHPLAHTTPLSAEFQTEPGGFFPEGARCASASMNLDECSAQTLEGSMALFPGPGSTALVVQVVFLLSFFFSPGGFSLQNQEGT